MPFAWRAVWSLYLLVALIILFYSYMDRGMSQFAPREGEFRKSGIGQTADANLLALWLTEYGKQEFRRTGQIIFGVGWVCVGFVLMTFTRPTTEIPVRRSDIPNVSYR